MRTGWFKVHRQVFDNPICTKDAEYFFVWCYLLSEARYEEERVLFGKEEIILEKGQLITTTKEIASKLNINESKVIRILKRFEIEKQIEKRTCTKNTVITILSWDLYQESEKQNEERVTNERRTSEERVTNERRTSGKPSYYIKEEKKEINKEIENERKEVSAYYPDDEKLNKAFSDFVEMRKKIKKPMTERAVKMAIKKLDNLSNMDNDLAINILEQSILCCWQDLYPLKTDNGLNKNQENIDWNKI